MEEEGEVEVGAGVGVREGGLSIVLGNAGLTSTQHPMITWSVNVTTFRTDSVSLKMTKPNPRLL